MKKIFNWLKAPFYRIDNTDEVDWLLLLVLLVVAIILMVGSYLIII